jgi:hypothetical protein
MTYTAKVTHKDGITQDLEDDSALEVPWSPSIRSVTFFVDGQDAGKVYLPIVTTSAE